jgi:NAD(P)-dependent dehydrogenase (short-subunit alcohol dehydrogenase family)
MSRLSKKVCIITGAGGSVGRAAALAFARDDALVVGCDVNAVTSVDIVVDGGMKVW